MTFQEILLATPRSLRTIALDETALAAAGLVSNAHLIQRGQLGVWRALGDRTPPEHVGAYFAALLLTQLDDIDWEMAAMLVEAGVIDFDSLASAGLQTIERALDDRRPRMSVYRVAELQRDAARVAERGCLALVPEFHSKSIAKDVTFHISHQRASILPPGVIVFSLVPPGGTTVYVERDGYHPITVRVKVGQQLPFPEPELLRIGEFVAEDSRLSERVEEGGDRRFSLVHGYQVHVVSKTPEDVEDGTRFYVLNSDDGASIRLMSLLRARKARIVEITVVEVPRELSSSLRQGQIVRRQSGVFEPIEGDLRSVRLELLRLALGPAIDRMKGPLIRI